MALNAYLQLRGQKQGDIRGSVIQKGREGRILVIACSHEIISPRDAASGQATGKRMHKPLVITKELDKASPLLRAAVATNEVFTIFRLDFYSALVKAGVGAEFNDFTITLENASIASTRMTMPNTRDPALAKFATYEEIAFSYQKITWTWNDGGIVAVDDWTAAR